MPILIDPNSNKKDRRYRKDRIVKETEKIENMKMIVKIYLKKERRDRKDRRKQAEQAE